MFSFVQVEQGIFALTLPMEDLTTQVYLFKTPAGNLLFDSANGDEDIDKIVLPALSEQGLSLKDLCGVVLSHSHGDHAGGARRLYELCPTLPFYAYRTDYLPQGAHLHAVQDGEVLCDCLQLLHLPGHTYDCVGILDQRTQTLVCADALQQWGIGRYGLALGTVQGYLQTLATVQRAPIARLLSSHDYHPLGGVFDGEDAIAALCTFCRSTVETVASFAKAQEGMDAREIMKAFWAAHPELPPLADGTVQAVLQ